MATQKERSSSNGSPGTTPTPPPASGLQTEEGTATRPRATSSETPANQGAAFDQDIMEKFFSFMSFYEQHQQGAPALSNNSNNNNATPMSLDGSSYARGNQQQRPTFAPYEPQRGSVNFMPHPQPASGQEKTLDALQVQSQFAHVLKLQTTRPFDGNDFFTWSFEFELMMEGAQILGFFDGTSGMGLVLGGQSPVVLTGHADASWADDQATQRSSQGYTFSLGSGSVSWRATRSSSVLGSSCEAEIYAGAMAAQELRWLTYLLTDLGEPPRSPPVLYVDNKAMLALCREQRLEHITKHIALRYFLARELQQRGQLRLAYVASEANTADVFTKALAPCDHQRFCTQLACFALPYLTGLVTPSSPPLRLWGVSQLMAKGIHLEANSTTQKFKLYHGKGGLYIGKAVLKDNVFVLDFVPDLGTADSDGIVTFTSWTHPPDLDPDFSPEGFW
ncbi:unnamed protein product [Closterium sp. NIES-53]